MMKQTKDLANPTANITINKGRLRQYKKNGLPTYYLQKDQEFEIEIFNPTKKTILAVISLDDQKISQGGLVLRPGERIFLDRYLDVARKFKFDTYNVNNSNEVKKAIQNNGDFLIEFYNEMDFVLQNSNTYGQTWPPQQPNIMPYPNGNFNQNGMWVDTNINKTLTPDWSAGYETNPLINYSDGTNISLTDSLSSNNGLVAAYFSNTLETGRIEPGAESKQKLDNVDKLWEYIPTHTIKYKLLPLSQKEIGLGDTKIKLYCTSCGTKIKKNDRFCSRCGAKQ